MEFDLENSSTGFDAVSALFDIESVHTPSFIGFEYTDVRFSLHCHSLSLISQAQSSYKFDGYIAYLAGNYIDRFPSEQAVPENKPCIVRLLVIASFSLAAKMRNVDFTVRYSGKLLLSNELQISSSVLNMQTVSSSPPVNNSLSSKLHVFKPTRGRNGVSSGMNNSLSPKTHQRVKCPDHSSCKNCCFLCLWTQTCWDYGGKESIIPSSESE
ncbi:putative equilibrative nucleotide transporter 3-like [Capsicum annuum]|nr:putative equilibrative nucleotide transporter 3-like [Capsicum annuum]